MFAIAFDLVVAEVEQNYPRHFSMAYGDIESTLRRFGFGRIQGAYMSATEKTSPTWPRP